MRSRTKNTQRNIIASYLLMIVQMIFQFVSRSVIVYTLGAGYLGLSSLFTSILSVLGIAESGFSASMIYFMYKPLADGDTKKVCSLLNYLRKVYVVVGSVILGLGLLITPFCSVLIKGDVPADINVYVLYILYLINTSVGYFLFAYKTSLLTAVQRLDLTKIANTVVIIIQYSLQLLALIIFNSYYLFVGAMILGTTLVNMFTSYVCKKYFPQYECCGEIDIACKKDIKNKVVGMLICNISGVTYTSLDSIVISSFIGLSTVAIYNNYMVIYSTVASFIALIRGSMQASIGDSIATESLKKNHDDVRLWQFLFSVIAIWCMTCLICLYQPFMRVWMGDQMMLPMIDVVLIGVWFMEGTVQHAFFLYLGGAGLWNEMKWAYIFSTFFNLTMNVLLGRSMGVTGIILASLLASTISGLFWQCSLIFKYYFKMSFLDYIAKQMMYFGNAAVIAGVTYLICNVISCGGVLELISKAILCSFLTAVQILIVYHKSEYFNKSKVLFLKVVNKC